MTRAKISDSEFRLALQDALRETNHWLKNEYPEINLSVRIETRLTIRDTDKQLKSAQSRRVHWDWGALHRSRVAYKLHEGWMFSLRLEGDCAGASYGRVDAKDDFASIEYIERNADIELTKGLMTATAFQFVYLLAAMLDISYVRINNPFEEVVPYYEKVLGVSRHEEDGVVQFLWKKVVQ